MKRDCSDLWDAILDLAEGKPNEAAAEHLKVCPGCQEKFKQAAKLVGALRMKHEAPPIGLVEWAKGLVPALPRVSMRLLRTTLSMAGARSASADFQSIYEAEGVQIRVMYSKVPEGWEVVSRVPSQDWEVANAQGPLQVDSKGRFEFVASDLSQSLFELSSDRIRLTVPSGSEAVNGADERDS